MGAYKHIRATMKQEWKGIKTDDYNYKKSMQSKMIDWRREPLSVVPVSRPSNLTRARELGYKAKEGVYVFRARVRKAGGTHTRPSRGRKPKKMGTTKLTRGKSIQWIAEERVNRRFPFLEVLNSYLAGEDGQRKFFDVICLDPLDPVVIRSSNMKWITNRKHAGRVYRGKTSAGKASRGLRSNKGKGAEKLRPSIRANRRMGK